MDARASRRTSQTSPSSSAEPRMTSCSISPSSSLSPASSSKSSAWKVCQHQTRIDCIKLPHPIIMFQSWCHGLILRSLSCRVIIIVLCDLVWPARFVNIQFTHSYVLSHVLMNINKGCQRTWQEELTISSSSSSSSISSSSSSSPSSPPILFICQHDALDLVH